jgi:hypothetical protein
VLVHEQLGALSVQELRSCSFFSLGFFPRGAAELVVSEIPKNWMHPFQQVVGQATLKNTVKVFPMTL